MLFTSYYIYIHTSFWNIDQVRFNDDGIRDDGGQKANPDVVVIIKTALDDILRW